MNFLTTQKLYALAFTGLFSCPIVAVAQSGIATWNLGWLMGQAVHAKWVAGCQSKGWKTESELKASGLALPPVLQGLPYCDVHDGIDFTRKSACIQALGAAGKNRPNSLDSPDGKCRVSPDLADWSQYEKKVKALRETFLAMEKDGVTLVGLQEVFDEQAVRQILPIGWEVRTTSSLKDTPKIPQHVGLAWKTSTHQPKDFMPIMALSSIGSRPLRPGLQFNVDVEGTTVDALVVHMKAGCRSVAMHAGKKPSEQEACPILAKQVPVVEAWIDDRVGKNFIVLGDFNRSLLRELEQFPKPDSQQFGNTPDGAAKWMAPEWNDNVPEGSLITVIPHKKRSDGTLIAGDYFCSMTTGIDHVIVSESLRKRIQVDAKPLELLPVSYLFEGKRLPVSKTTVPPSDHCARFIRLR